MDTEQTLKIHAIMKTVLIRVGYTLEEAKEIVNNLTTEMKRHTHRGAVVSDLFKKPFEKRWSFIDKAVTWDASVKGHPYWARIHSRLRDYKG